ncbi:MAG: hypothetical protein P4L10_17715 [Acidobacteriaceae bacterium]|nr:hypothetical protein [Acidobacteriaceae bacterium]
MSALTLNRDILGVIIPALKLTLDATFPDIEGEGSFGSKKYMKNIKITSYKINEERFDINRYEYVAPTYKLKGSFEAIYFNVEFEYVQTWLGITVSSGPGSAAITNVNSEILVFFNESEPDVQIPHPWDVKNLTISAWISDSTWATTELHEHFVPHFHQVVDKSMDEFAHNLLKTYTYIEDVFPDDIDLVFRNKLMTVQPSMAGTYFSLAFKMNITVNNNIHRKMYRKMNGTIVPQGDFDYCLPAELIPAVLDTLGKGGYYDTEVMPEIWGFESDSIKEFYNIIPSLKEKYPESAKFAIHCQSSRFETVNDITQRDWIEPVLQLQDPGYCFAYLVDEGEYFLLLDVFMRYYYEMKCKVDSYYGHILYSELYAFRTVPELPYSRHEIMGHHLTNYSEIFHDSELVSPGIKVIPNRHTELTFASAYISREEICFYYKENRPIANNN